MQRVEHTGHDQALAQWRLTAQLAARLEQHAHTGIHQHCREGQGQRCVGQLVRQHQSERGSNDTDQRYKSRSPVAHHPLAQPQDGTDRRGHADGQQSDRRRLDHRQTKTEDQQGHGQNAAASPGQRQHRTNDRSQSCSEKWLFDHC
ncbi:hypothetical protein D3C79_762000 [compost metagenome]